jgi:putative Mn2+ efflux pump MntP
LSLIEILIIAIALAMDAFSVSISAGVLLKNPKPRQYFRLSFHFGLFQFLMPLGGYVVGEKFSNRIEAFDHWVAFSLLVIVGVKMIKESTAAAENRKKHIKDPSKGLNLVILSLATSIDAFAIGFSFNILRIPIIFPSIVIGFICFIFSFLGVFFGKKIGKFLGKRAEFAGGSILILIGIKILFDHL